MAVYGELVPREEEKPQVVQAQPVYQPVLVRAEVPKEEDKTIGIVLVIVGILLIVLGFYKLTR